MCLTVNGDQHLDLKPKTATKDIYTLKLAFAIKENNCVSYYQQVEQGYNKLLKAKIMDGRYLIYKGLHSIIDPENKVSEYFDSLFRGSKGIILCKIPKGSKYYIGINGDIVSNRLVLLKPILVNTCSEIQLDTKIKNVIWTYSTDKIFWKKTFKIAKDLGYKIGL